MSWRWDALCVQEPEDVQDFFFSTDPEDIYYAQCICQGCPVSIDCLQFALRVKEGEGIWGGHTPKERRRLVRSMKRSGAKAIDESYLKIDLSIGSYRKMGSGARLPVCNEP